MDKHNQKSKIYVIESIGLIMVVAFIWINEVCDLPHYLFGAIKTPTNWIESLFESFIILIMGAIVLYKTRQILKKLRYLENLLPICTYCKKIRVGSKWIPVDQYLRGQSDIDFSHSYCPKCTQEHFGWIYENNESLVFGHPSKY